MNVVITGADGFIGRNLSVRLAEHDGVNVIPFVRGDGVGRLQRLLHNVDFVFHLAGVNRPKSVDQFWAGNTTLTEELCRSITATGRPIPVLYTSSIQVDRQNPYGDSKRAAEVALTNLSRENGSPVHIFRLPNVFGKWSRPDYNSVVATFCHSVARGLPIRVDDPAVTLTLVYIDDLVDRFLDVMKGRHCGGIYCDVEPQYSVSVGRLAEILKAFQGSRDTLVTERVGVGLERALYATFLSFFPPECFSYAVPRYDDSRGAFIEMLKTRDSGQISCFTAHPGTTRGGHYHHSKTEKFLVLRGTARFRFRHLLSGEQHELETSGDSPRIVETVPGWTHDITNIGADEMIVILWANEAFDRGRPDTITCPI